MRLCVESLRQCRGDARLAEAGFAGDQHDLAVAFLGARPAAQCRSISSSRPTSRVSVDPCKASNRLSTTLGRITCQVGTGAAMPFTSTAPRSRYSKRSPTQRHLIVHRRGLVDARYIERTSDHAMIGDHLKLDAAYIEASLVLVRDTGCSIYSASQNMLLEAPTTVHE
jgi:hypothetical protein